MHRDISSDGDSPPQSHHYRQRSAPPPIVVGGDDNGDDDESAAAKLMTTEAEEVWAPSFFISTPTLEAGADLSESMQATRAGSADSLPEALANLTADGGVNSSSGGGGADALNGWARARGHSARIAFHFVG